MMGLNRVLGLCLALGLLLMAADVSRANEAKDEAARDITTMTPAERQALLNKDLTGALRGFVWGLPRVVILENEKATFVGEDEKRLFYLDHILGMRSLIGYDFLNDKLWRAKIFIEKYYLDPEDRIEDMMRIRESLSRRFGEPKDEQFEWIKDTEKGYPDNWGWAILRGEMRMRIYWENEDTIVIAAVGAKVPLNPELEEPDFTVTYQSKSLSGKKDRKAVDELFQLPDFSAKLPQ